MKVLEKENVKSNDLKENEITIGEAYGLHEAIYDLNTSCPSIKGRIIFALQKNEGKIESILKKAEKKRKEIVDKYVKIDKKTGQYILTELTEEEISKGVRAQFIYKDENGKAEAEKEIQEVLNEKIEIDFHKIRMADFENLDIVPMRNQKIGLFIKYFITEDEGVFLEKK